MGNWRKAYVFTIVVSLVAVQEMYCATSQEAARVCVCVCFQIAYVSQCNAAQDAYFAIFLKAPRRTSTLPFWRKQPAGIVLCQISA